MACSLWRLAARSNFPGYQEPQSMDACIQIPHSVGAGIGEIELVEADLISFRGQLAVQPLRKSELGA